MSAARVVRDAPIGIVANPPPKAGVDDRFVTAFAGVAKMRQGRLAEAEADVRRALLGRLKAVRKYHGETAQSPAC